MGCILLRDPDYDSPRNTPPVVLEDPSSPMNEFIDIDRSGGTVSDAGAPITEQTFYFRVRDPDIDQSLVGIPFIDYDPDDPEPERIADDIVIPASAMETRSRFFVVDHAELPRGCHVIELHVSREFRNSRDPQPVEDGDLGRGIWFVRVFANEDDVIDLRGCRNPAGAP
jgi:hypothetical protein